MAKTILIADDSPIIRKMLCRLFEVEEGYDICAEATNGQEAINLALKYRPNLIILDFVMPVLNGLEAARQLKNIMPNVPIILLTQHANLGSAMLRTNSSIDRIISKSDAFELMEHVRSLVPV
jgi:CheY-like chemotaxis protein